MNFEDFARSHGLIFKGVQFDRWIPTPTEDHPRSSNGRYKFLGNVGWVQNWATMDKPATWFADGENLSSPRVRQKINESLQKRQDLAKNAASKAIWILEQSELSTHPYLERKGFPNEQGNVWEKDGKSILVIPMRRDNGLVGLQLIDDQGNKKFLHGQTSKGAFFCMDAKGIPIFCEGYATGLSIRTVMKTNNINYSIYVCFSASNMKFVAQNFREGIIVADNDPNQIGEKAAIETGKPYWISPTVGEDFNDYHMHVGNFKAAQDLKKMLISLKTVPRSA